MARSTPGSNDWGGGPRSSGGARPGARAQNRAAATYKTKLSDPAAVERGRALQRSNNARAFGKAAAGSAVLGAGVQREVDRVKSRVTAPKPASKAPAQAKKKK